VAELLVLVELGSNATRCLLARITPGVGFDVLHQERVQTRLGSGPPGMLAPDAIALTLATVRGFLDRVRNGATPRVVAVATAAVRDAGNPERLLEPLKRQGVDVRVLTGAEEARLGARAAMLTLPVRTGLVVDLGGSSLQLTRLRAGRIVSTASLPLGALRTTRQFLLHDPPTRGELTALRQATRAALSRSLSAAPPDDTLVGLGGTVRTLARIHLRSHGLDGVERHGLRLRRSDVAAVRDRLEALPLALRRAVPGVKAERADILVAGAVVLQELMRLSGLPALVVCTHGVRDGMLFHEVFPGEAGPVPLSSKRHAIVMSP
jgi:exopolyphosphatase/guanosine-5'-triphosphate,3'-diphosphate pyrophosphatase